MWKIRFYNFHTEQGYDWLRISGGGGQTVYFHGLSPTPPAPQLHEYTGPWQTMGGTTRPAYLEFEWYSDSGVNWEGYKIDSVKLGCRQTYSRPVNDLEVERNYPHDGYLLGTNDVIYVKVLQPEGLKLGLLLWPIDDANFDVFASPSPQTLPDRYHYQWAGMRPGRNPELVVVDSFGVLGGGGSRWIYVAIGSADGAGQFRFYANVHAPYPQETILTASTDWSPSEQTRTSIRNILRKTSVATYLATEGRYLINHWVIRWNNNTGFVRFPQNFEGNSYCDPSENNPDTTCWSSTGNFIKLSTAMWCGCRPAEQCTPLNGLPNTCWWENKNIQMVASNPVLHELGHCAGAFRFRDEYFDYQGCGHSAMTGKQYGEPYDGNVTDFCVYLNGGQDHPNGHSSAQNNWACMVGKLYQSLPVIPPVPNYTPDAFYKIDTPMVLGDFGWAVTIDEQQY